MQNNENYFNAPVFESVKSLYACRYQSELELELMKKFDVEPKIKSFHQPLLISLVRNPGEEKFINIDFWIEYFSGKIDLLFIEKDFVIDDKAQIYILSNSKKLFNPESFSFAVLNQQKSQFRRIISANLKLRRTAGIEDFCFVNFAWIN